MAGFKGDIEELKKDLDAYRRTGDPDLLRKLRSFIFEFKDYEGDDPTVKELKDMFHV